ncbi:MAG TPA: molybdopterin-dependent oxidoreductase [Polyangiaceae bacterium]
MDDNPKLAKVVEARMALRRRFEERARQTPSMADTAPQGSGPTNRHGMPKLPVGQVVTQKWPVLDLGVLPDIDQKTWRLRVDGACKAPYELDFDGLMSLERTEEASDFHCVTTWSRMDLRFSGVRLSEVLALAEPEETATHLMCHGYDGYSTNLSLEEALKPDVLLAFGVDGKPLPKEHGGPVRVITPQLYAWKGSKWISRLELLDRDRPGFWEERGYSMTAYPWRNDRYG